MLFFLARPALAINPSTHYLKVYVGDDFKLTCETVKIGAKSIKWGFKHMRQQPTSQDYTITTKQVDSSIAQSVLQVYKAKQEFTGYYQCSDDVYPREMDEVFVDVIGKIEKTFQVTK